ncbi:hypothetical protein DFJ58DRAFT_916953 [Suillus subalutaceus]|uniref:uncharacterized protein n=1 Tax=Suillus subalutaceus TaxID=48586 RepID=UPI001B878169|nr:uncharacterized protein DFJ58DRAFT_916953 [Suillus subalutaceus]KAG1839564.1 hypothetical protein DFJ58DRAFT_916953 [Suillus subalutaceus]
MAALDTNRQNGVVKIRGLMVIDMVFFMGMGITIFTCFLTLTQVDVMHALIGFLMGGLLSILRVWALEETDLNPVSGVEKISQLLFAWIQPGNVVANIIARGVAEAGHLC